MLDTTTISYDKSSIQSDISETITALLQNLPNVSVLEDGALDCSAYIPALEPWGLGKVPGFRTLPPDENGTYVEDTTWRDDPDPQKGWFAWRDKVSETKIIIHRAMRDRPELRA